MSSSNYNWQLGETVRLPWKSEVVKKSCIKSYAYLLSSRYVCIRERGDGLPGILVKGMGKLPADVIQMVGGEPFCRDERAEAFTTDQYLCHRFPEMSELRLVLGIIRNSPALLQQFLNEKMPIRPDSTYWVRDVTRHRLFQKRPNYFDPAADALFNPTPEANVHHRLTIVYFSRQGLSL